MGKDDFLWHKVKKDERDKIKQEAKSIMDSFVEALAGVEEMPKQAVERNVFMRKELCGETKETRDREICGDGKKNEKFRKTFFDNASSKKGDCITAEK